MQYFWEKPCMNFFQRIKSNFDNEWSLKLTFHCRIINLCNTYLWEKPGVRLFQRMKPNFDNELSPRSWKRMMNLFTLLWLTIFNRKQASPCVCVSVMDGCVLSEPWTIDGSSGLVFSFQQIQKIFFYKPIWSGGYQI